MSNSLKIPIVSVVMPVYNSAKYLKESIQSILDQTYTNLEIIIVDDGSTDDSPEIVMSFTDPRIRLYRNEENKGIPYTRNRTLELAQGKYIAFLDSDDIALPARIEKQVKYLEENVKLGLLGTWIKTSGVKSNQVVEYKGDSDDIKIQLLFNNYFTTSTVMLRKKIIDDNRIFFEEGFPQAEDYTFWFEVSRHTRVSHLPEVLNLYRVHQNQTTVLDNVCLQTCINNARKKYLKYFGVLYSEKEYMFHLMLAGKDVKHLTSNEALSLHRWMMKLFRANKRLNYVAHGKFKNYLGNYWMSFVSNFYFKSYSPCLFFTTYFSPLSLLSELSFRQKLMFFLKSVIMYKI